MTKFLKKFENHSDYETYISGGGKVYLPNVSLCTDEYETHYNPLPYDYKVEYLESTGTQLIDTEIIPDYQTKVQFKFLNKEATNITGVIIGYVIGSGNASDWRFFNANSKAYFDVPGNRRIYGSTINENIVYELELGNYYVKNLLNGSNIVTGASYGSVVVGVNSIKLNGNTKVPSKNRWYYVKIYSNNVLVRDLIPVVDKQGFGCMYDTVSGKLFENKGTGEFIVGPKV